jgi:DNA-binding MarR family transcriptional regulator
MTPGRHSNQHRTWRFGTVETAEREAYLLIQHAAGMQIQELAILLRPIGITPEQYHVLRVLDDAAADGLACSAVAGRSVSGDPDVTRLLDRLEKHGWASRSRDAGDRRIVTARITAEGRELLRRVAEPVASLHEQQFAPLSADETRQLRGLIHKIAHPA